MDLPVGGPSGVGGFWRECTLVPIAAQYFLHFRLENRRRCDGSRKIPSTRATSRNWADSGLPRRAAAKSRFAGRLTRTQSRPVGRYKMHTWYRTSKYRTVGTYGTYGTAVGGTVGTTVPTVP